MARALTKDEIMSLRGQAGNIRRQAIVRNASGDLYVVPPEGQAPQAVRIHGALATTPLEQAAGKVMRQVAPQRDPNAPTSVQDPILARQRLNALRAANGLPPDNSPIGVTPSTPEGTVADALGQQAVLRELQAGRTVQAPGSGGKITYQANETTPVVTTAPAKGPTYVPPTATIEGGIDNAIGALDARVKAIQDKANAEQARRDAPVPNAPAARDPLNDPQSPASIARRNAIEATEAELRQGLDQDKRKLNEARLRQYQQNEASTKYREYRESLKISPEAAKAYIDEVRKTDPDTADFLARVGTKVLTQTELAKQSKATTDAKLAEIRLEAYQNNPIEYYRRLYQIPRPGEKGGYGAGTISSRLENITKTAVEWELGYEALGRRPADDTRAAAARQAMAAAHPLAGLFPGVPLEELRQKVKDRDALKGVLIKEGFSINPDKGVSDEEIARRFKITPKAPEADGGTANGTPATQPSSRPKPKELDDDTIAKAQANVKARLGRDLTQADGPEILAEANRILNGGA